MIQKTIKILLAYNQPTGGIYSNYDGKRIGKEEFSKQIDLSEVGVIEEYETIRDLLNSKGFYLESFNLLDNVTELIRKIHETNYDVVFNLVESVGGDSMKEMYVAGIFELMNVPYTGCSAVTLGLCLNKHRAKLIIKGAGYNVPEWKLFETPNKIIFDSKPKFPLIVKPSREDASVGISEQSIVYNEKELAEQVEFLYSSLRQPIIAEEFIDGREINSAILGDKNKIALPLSEIDFSTLPYELPKIVTYEGKWIKHSTYYKHTIPICPAPLDEVMSSKLKSLALEITTIFGCRDYARVDFRLAKNDIPYVLEVNPNPDISIDAGFARAAEAYGISYDELMLTIIQFALERK